ncbi:fluoride efflux transporter CrcB [Ammoniphilus sp. YIM 78166]|uniref:fluoride efflux transporter CrcB n=1 Tax=Ammoniphilus sp. YIM 78166 TaxID=1644106 RepID=UPI001F0D6DAD|nr:fluoride efflux transporter CrcB [Ammoniphilus sp. YIM 78166]
MVSLAIGGFFGSISRYSFGEWLHTEQGFPIGTLIVNLLGCLFLGWFFTMSTTRWERISPQLKLGIGTGFTGSFTTFSTFSVETLQLLSQEKLGLALFYVLTSIGGGILLALAGIQLAVLGSKKPSFKEGSK